MHYLKQATDVWIDRWLIFVYSSWASSTNLWLSCVVAKFGEIKVRALLPSERCLRVSEMYRSLKAFSRENHSHYFLIVCLLNFSFFFSLQKHPLFSDQRRKWQSCRSRTVMQQGQRLSLHELWRRHREGLLGVLLYCNCSREYLHKHLWVFDWISLAIVEFVYSNLETASAVKFPSCNVPLLSISEPNNF